MAYTFACPIDLGSTGVTLLATFIDSSGTVHATLRNLATNELADGFYRFSSSSVPDGYRGAIYFHTGTYTSGLGDINIFSTVALSPQETENADVKTSSLGGAGTGPFSVTVTVTDGTDPLQNVTVAIYDGNTLAGRLITDVDGEATFSLAAGTYTATTYKPGYTSAPATGRTVTGNQTGTLTDDIEMTATGSITPPANPDLCTLYGVLLLASGEPAVNVPVYATLITNRPGEANGNVILTQGVSTNTNGSGYFQMDLIRTDEVDPTATYQIKCLPAAVNLKGITLTTATQDIAALLT